VAGLASVFGYVWVTGWLHLLFFGKTHLEQTSAVAIGASVAAAWLVLALSRKWEAEPSAIDLLGRVLGVTAIALDLFTYLEFEL
jgi:hypothetical protein